jgi:hypothetical protein
MQSLGAFDNVAICMNATISSLDPRLDAPRERFFPAIALSSRIG